MYSPQLLGKGDSKASPSSRCAGVRGVLMVPGQTREEADEG